MGFIHALIGIPMMVFGNAASRIEEVIFQLMPVVMGVIGFVVFVVFAAVYNLPALWVGGFELEVKNLGKSSDRGGA